MPPDSVREETGAAVEVEHATALAERYGDAIVRISAVLDNDRLGLGKVNRIRAIIAGLDAASAPSFKDEGGDLVHLPALVAEQFGVSRSEARRLQAQGGLFLDGEPIEPGKVDWSAEDLDGRVLRLGRRREVTLSFPAPSVSQQETCEHCPDGHRRPGSKPMYVAVGPGVDSDGQPTHLRVGYTNGHHVSENEVQWLRGLIASASSQQERCAGRGWHTAGGNDPSACACPAGEAWAAGQEETGTRELRDWLLGPEADRIVYEAIASVRDELGGGNIAMSERVRKALAASLPTGGGERETPHFDQFCEEVEAAAERFHQQHDDYAAYTTLVDAMHLAQGEIEQLAAASPSGGATGTRELGDPPEELFRVARASEISPHAWRWYVEKEVLKPFGYRMAAAGETRDGRELWLATALFSESQAGTLWVQTAEPDVARREGRSVIRVREIPSASALNPDGRSPAERWATTAQQRAYEGGRHAFMAGYERECPFPSQQDLVDAWLDGYDRCKSQAAPGEIPSEETRA